MEGFSYSPDRKILMNALLVIQCGLNFSTVALQLLCILISVH